MANPIRSNMSHQFATVPRAEIPRSSIQRNTDLKTAFDAGYLVPIFLDEGLPGDTFNLNMTVMGRLATPLHPFMDNMRVSIFFFGIPKRLLWDNWQRFNGEQDNPSDSTDYMIPQIAAPADTGWPEESLADYMAIPTKVADLESSALFFRAYQLTYNEWFRDQNLQDSVPFVTDDGPDDAANYTLLKRGKRHDYFTSCLPWPQKGPSVELPIGDTAPVVGAGDLNPEFNNGLMRQTGDQILKVDTGGTNLVTWVDPKLEVSLADATAATVNQLRQAVQIQKLYERDARGGTRYTEIIRSHFGVTSPDARLQRPEYLGGGVIPINVSPVVQNSASSFEGGPTASTPQGNLAAIGTINTGRRIGFTSSFTEHMIILGLACVTADLTYQQGLERMHSRKTRWDFYWPALSHIGEQAVLNKEIYAQGPAVTEPDGSPTDDAVFGYIPRHDEYRYKPSRITGPFRSNHSQSLDTWHLSQDFGNLPTLSPEFIEEDPPVDRVVATPEEPDVIFNAFFEYRCARPMPVNSVPGLIDHF